jgi:endoglucanase
MKKCILVIIFLSQICFGQSSIFEINKKLGKGINMGNMFEAPSETAWGNPFKDDYFQRISSLGFKHVRIPIRWDVPDRALQVAPYTINPDFLKRIKSVIDLALKENLLVIINMHHHEDLFLNPEANNAEFLSQWAQISTYFKDYNERLLFEVLNEPNSNLTSAKWNLFFAEALTTIRKTNPTRAVLLGTSNWGGLNGVSALKIPKDENLILTIHYYEPFNFTHQGAEWVSGTEPWLGTKWENTNLERNEIIGQFEYAKTFASENKLPIHIGEFGSYGKADLASRIKWSNFLARWFENQGFSWAYWEFSAGFGIYDPNKNTYLTALVDALIKNPISEAEELKTTTIYKSDFSSNNGNWNLSTQPSATANISNADSSAIINITKASTEGWHVQFTKNEIFLKKGKRYMVSFDAKSIADIGITNYLGQNSGSYKAYSNYKGFTLNNNFKAFNYSFVMNDADDSKARIVFDLGLNISKIWIKNIKIEEVLSEEIQGTVLSNFYENSGIKVFPNPFENEINIESLNTYQEIAIFDVTNKMVFEKKLKSHDIDKIKLPHLKPGLYFLKLKKEKEIQFFKIIKI